VARKSNISSRVIGCRLHALARGYATGSSRELEGASALIAGRVSREGRASHLMNGSSCVRPRRNHLPVAVSPKSIASWSQANELLSEEATALHYLH
jgi:hypothetical protein